MDTARALVTSLENTDIKKLTLIDIATVKKYLNKKMITGIILS